MLCLIQIIPFKIEHDGWKYKMKMQFYHVLPKIVVINYKCQSINVEHSCTGRQITAS